MGFLQRRAAPSDLGLSQRAATISAFAKAHGYIIVEKFYDAVSGADSIAQRPGFKAMLDRIAGNGVRCILVESPDRFARDLTVELTGHDFLQTLGISLIPATAPDFFTEDTPTAVLVHQVLGVRAQFEKTSLVAKLKRLAARNQARWLPGYRPQGRHIIGPHQRCRAAPSRRPRHRRARAGYEALPW
jgi:DNA invertase Pin-like site-specific DNA recombinase